MIDGTQLEANGAEASSLFTVLSGELMVAMGTVVETVIECGSGAVAAILLDEIVISYVTSCPNICRAAYTLFSSMVTGCDESFDMVSSVNT